MGGKGSGRRSKSEIIPEDDYSFEGSGDPSTTLDQAPEPKPKAAAKPKKVSMTIGEMQEKLHILFSGLARVLKWEYPYTPEDYQQEARALSRLADKFPVLGQFMMMFDPILIILGLYVKFMAMKPKAVKPIPAPQPGQEMSNVSPFARISSN
jgi:hypothetical protein